MTTSPRALAAALLLAVASAAPAHAQSVAQVPPPADTALAGRPSNVGAMLRSFAVPGWGQASYDHYFRGGVYFAGHVANTYMLLKTLGKLSEARDIAGRREAALRAQLIADGVAPDSLGDAIAADPVVNHARSLIRARQAQREDWIAFGGFWVLMSGIDAFVTAHLADFPAEVTAYAEPRRPIGVSVRVPVR